MARKAVPTPKELREEAEAKLAQAVQDIASEQSAAELLHELRVHKIELEMQNDALRKSQVALEESRDRFVDLYEFAPVGYLTLDSSGLITEINLRGAVLLGRERKSLLGTRFVRCVVDADRDVWHRFFIDAKFGRDRSTLDLAMLRGDGTEFYARAECVGTGLSMARVVLSDITEQKRAEDEIHRLAFYDPLTCLPNRRLLQDRLGQALTGSRRSRRYGALLFLDLDDFKKLNDTRGHDAGDRLLIEVARRILASLRAGDTVSRVGGDEFLVMLEGLSSDSKYAAFQTREVGEKIREALNKPYLLADGEFYCSASLGATLFFGDNESVETMLKHADLAMYKAKNAGCNTLRFFDPAMQVALDERSALENALRLAIDAQQLHLQYQPQVDYDGNIVGAEALLRWMHPERGMVPPSEFIPLAEDTGLILPIGHWVLEAACKQIKVWSSLPAANSFPLAVNVSAHQFLQPGFVSEVAEVLSQTGADPQRLKLEITESMVLHDVGEISEKMIALKKLGVRFAVDDFGTGYSSLSYLTGLPLDQLKIDRSFVLNLLNSRKDAIIAQTIITMSKSLGLHVIAEGVESEAQSEFLHYHGCTTYQGYLFSKPLPLDKFD